MTKRISSDFRVRVNLLRYGIRGKVSRNWLEMIKFSEKWDQRVSGEIINSEIDFWTLPKVFFGEQSEAKFEQVTKNKAYVCMSINFDPRTIALKLLNKFRNLKSVNED